jgi:DNA-binding transcriptional MerR regulator
MEVSIRKHFSVTEVCRKLGVKPHVLRYWEQQFELKPERNSARRRIYSEPQIERLQLIKHLVRNEKLTVQGARRQLAKMPSQLKPAAVREDQRQTLLWLKKELLSIRALIEDANR